MNDPFDYEPHPLCMTAAEEVKEWIRNNPILKEDADRGKMFGVLVVSKDSMLYFLAAYSGLLAGRNDWADFVPPVFDAQQPNGHFKQTERMISEMKDLPERRKQMSQELQLWLFRQYRMLNAEGKEKDLVEIWQDYHQSPKLRKKFPLPPGGSGDCCAPKLLQYAYLQGLEPVCMAEFWWGASPKAEIRHHEQYYPACRGKCKPILTWMLGLGGGTGVTAALPSWEVAVVYEDEWLCVVNKPANLLSIPGKEVSMSVLTIMRQRYPDYDGPLMVHRLDMHTSGLLIITKDREANKLLQQQFGQRIIKKKYVALVEGKPAQPSGTISLPMRKDPLDRPRQVVDWENGKTAVTDYETIEERNGRTLLALYPKTGRTHQLRVHCAHPDGLGCPIVGDTLYGHRSDRLYLHASELWFTHPITGEEMHVVAEPDYCRTNNGTDTGTYK
jgi:tRNA pseudouridine32 synthase/23S rRNA pseudouridine746 synthase